mgnify:CR=1 FL=1
MKNMKKRMRVMGKALRMELREHKSSFIVYMTLRALVILVMILQILNRNFENVFLCALTLVLLIMPSLIQINLKIELPTALEIIMLLFIFAAEILGEIQAYYEKIPMWDTVLHTLNGFLMAAIGFALVDILNRNKKISFQLSPAFLAVVAFCFSMTIGVIWEFFEFGMDQIFHLDMQKDTIVNTIYSVMLDPAGGNHVVGVTGIRDVAVNGESLGLGGYLDIGLLDTMEDLLKLPGVGRKTANLILGGVYPTPGVVVADTHCIRITGLLGLTDGTKDPGKVEKQLRACLPPEEANDFCHRLVLHGRAVCRARKPDCPNCTLRPWCDHFQKNA